ncbi:hypothetical protein N7592_09530 [Pseudomonas juntendi]|uniref:hypothetical protein n=1 Tax=Pseudomonas juntendi TaxID=2666183 RepID=UPI00244A7475|nr:hypothetical protein [Pseudomonas juntendi]MDG9873440.1 hypothetical protein [Pseudomonas juntendi]
MTIVAETLAQLAQALKAQGARHIADLTFIRAPYRCGKRWICSVVRRGAGRKLIKQS